jgi:hypothetical protein
LFYFSLYTADDLISSFPPPVNLQPATTTCFTIEPYYWHVLSSDIFLCFS